MSFNWALVIVFIVSYLIGSINFSKILSWFKHKNIEKEGSGNPGTMNMLRTYGLKTALLTLLLEVVKSGLTAWLCAYITRGYGYYDLVFYFSGFMIVIGSCFPFFGLVKGGKGVACAFGVCLFSKLWYVALALFVVGIILIAVTEYGFISSLVFILVQTIITTILVVLGVGPYSGVQSSVLVCVLVWLMCLLVIARHYKNIYRLCTGQENKANFKASCKKMFHKRRNGVEEIPEDEVESSPEKVIDIDDNKN